MKRDDGYVVKKGMAISDKKEAEDDRRPRGEEPLPRMWK